MPTGIPAGVVPVWRALLHLAADTITEVSMELGGHAPVLVFPDTFVTAAHALRVGDGRDPQTDVEPLTNLRRVREAEQLIEDAVAGGASVAVSATIGSAGASSSSPRCSPTWW